jgi:prepilin-type N-terminal cleavage/methylation domain-containing protein
MNRKKGYTMMELLVVIALITGLSTVIVLNGTDSRSLTKVTVAAAQLESALLEAQAFGRSGRAYPPGDSDPKAFDRGYGVYIEENQTSVVIYGGSGDLDIPLDGVQPDEELYDSARSYETVDLNGVKVKEMKSSSIPGAGVRPKEAHLLFRRGEEEAQLQSKVPPFQNLNDFTITLEANGMIKKVVVNSAGLIYIE